MLVQYIDATNGGWFVCLVYLCSASTAQPQPLRFSTFPGGRYFPRIYCLSASVTCTINDCRETPVPYERESQRQGIIDLYRETAPVFERESRNQSIDLGRQTAAVYARDSQHLSVQVGVAWLNTRVAREPEKWHRPLVCQQLILSWRCGRQSAVERSRGGVRRP